MKIIFHLIEFIEFNHRWHFYQAKSRQWVVSYSKCQVIVILLPHKLIVHTNV